MKHCIATCAILLLGTSSSARAGAADPLQARLDLAEQYFRFPERIRDTLVAPQWLGDGERFVYWSATGPHHDTWVIVDARRRAQLPVIAADVLQRQLAHLAGPKGEPLSNPPFAITPDQQRIVFRWRERLFALALSQPRVVALAATDPAAALILPGHFAAPDGRMVALQRGSGFAVVDDNGRTIVERTGEPDYEWQVPDKAWSPDGRFLLVWRNDMRAMHKIPVVDYSDAREQVMLVPYAKVGTALLRAELYVVEPAAGRVQRVPDTAPRTIPSAKGESYDHLAGWRPDGSEALVLRLSRDAKRLDLVAVQPASARSRLVLREERPQSFVAGLEFEAGGPPTYAPGWSLQVTALADNRRFLWMSERDGWRHVYSYDYSGKLERQVTRGPFVVHSVVGVAPDAETFLVVASADGPTPYDRLLYRARLGGGGLERISPDPGVHRIALAPKGRYYIDGHSTRAETRVWDVGSTEDRERPFRYAQADGRALAELHFTLPEPLTVLAADGKTLLYGVLYKPWDFDARKRYPVIDYIYAGPFIAAVPWWFTGDTESRLANALAQMGFVVMLLDARGTPGRSKTFQDVSYGRVGQTEIPDHVTALRQAAMARPYMDLDRAGICGHSWGGYFTLRGMLTAPEVFKAGYAGAPGALEEEAIVNEPYLDLPSENPTGYAAGSNLQQAKNLRGALKLMHGTSDVNASLSTTMRMAAALIAAGKPFDLLLMPGQGHSPEDPAGRYYRDDVRRFFVRELGPPR